ncbi:aminodeoxychorismate/anthranilate synthase component II [Planktothrix agardhii 1806]|jgi:anthranilate synthase component II|uniref:anthranilate synthase component II n=1 Tax=Planktothrix agardhii TaxID=1160 RepID=UPI001F4679B1|nr:aminodeoxychorismate/anthranilate synthase component II [Planktothrix agardhii]MCF3569074.1 aminodeoxychorismate/anthranilate synthase component II [Planktothrix agardhii 1807]MCF3570572.1 aminodeoxychorismate/anthranilate synthase component II [Planktothrix agardhii 1805]MCF3586382.1 aminodeoxychorismate/anthranilate synthase component II [Planktothrix agardhii 1803]MCF3603245.1 aminodeoxychorismate/anthranilate synthase component II [Planktothrix agardhii 1804]MCF3615847.1 aminodeoxychori
MTRILLIDNYDSFTYNVSQCLSVLKIGTANPVIDVIRNDQITVEEVREKVKKGYYKAIVISPGPGRPSDAGITMDLIRDLGPSYEHGEEFWPGVPILGVCLGHQAIGEVFGGRVILAPEPIHGRASPIYHQRKGIFVGLPSPFDATRYHSLVVELETLPEVLKRTAWTAGDDLIMGLQHQEYKWIQGVQFHPESFLTKYGQQLLQNFLNLVSNPTDYESAVGGWIE